MSALSPRPFTYTYYSAFSSLIFAQTIALLNACISANVCIDCNSFIFKKQLILKYGAIVSEIKGEFGMNSVILQQSSRSRLITISCALVIFMSSGCSKSDDNESKSEKNNIASKSELTPNVPSITKGRAEIISPTVFECDVPGWRVTAQGTITASDGTTLTVPSKVNFKSGPKATDLYNECNGVTLSGVDALDHATIPVTDIDADGEIVSAYFFADNYFEFFINGKLVAVDPVPYWPFNTSVVRFRAKRPFTVAAKLIDWEENLGLGSETMRGVPFHTGDGGFVAVFKNANNETIAITDETWRAQSYYISPLVDPTCIKVVGKIRNSDACEVPGIADGENGYGLHWALPDDWAQVDFDDAGWPQAYLYTNADIGGSLARPAFANFTDLFDDPKHDAQFIWSSNLLLDNIVLTRRVIE